MRPSRGRGRYNNTGGRGAPNIIQKIGKGRWKDARQILKINRSARQMKNSPRSYSTRRNFVKKYFNQLNLERTVTNYTSQPTTTTWKKSISDSHGKHVSMREGGIITVTSDQTQSSLIKSEEMSSSEKCVFNDKGGITVIKLNCMPSTKNLSADHLSQTENEIVSMEDDDLEKLTLDDLPDARKSKILKSGVNTVFGAMRAPLYSSSVPLSSRLSQSNFSESSTSLPSHGFSILVTNLHREVTEEDIIELFSDVGNVINVQMIQYGTAIVIYLNKEEAIVACETYHNRLLDGQPMQCTLLPSTSPSPKSSMRISDRLSPWVLMSPRNRNRLSNWQKQSPQSSSVSQFSRTSVMNNPPSGPVNFTVRMP